MLTMLQVYAIFIVLNKYIRDDVVTFFGNYTLEAKYKSLQLRTLLIFYKKIVPTFMANSGISL